MAKRFAELGTAATAGCDPATISTIARGSPQAQARFASLARTLPRTLSGIRNVLYTRFRLRASCCPITNTPGSHKKSLRTAIELRLHIFATSSTVKNLSSAIDLASGEVATFMLVS